MDFQEKAVGEGTGQLYQTWSTHSPTEVLRLQIDGVEPIDASGEVCIVSAVCLSNTSTYKGKINRKRVLCE